MDLLNLELDATLDLYLSSADGSSEWSVGVEAIFLKLSTLTAFSGLFSQTGRSDLASLLTTILSFFFFDFLDSEDF